MTCFTSLNSVAVQFQFSPSHQRVSEGSGAVLVCVELLSGALSQSFHVELTPSSGSAGSYF